MKFTVDRARWVNAGHGVGPTRLLNAHSYRCCLGFVEKQLGVSDEKLLGVSTPCIAGVRNILTKVVPMSGKLTSSALAFKAMCINDDPTISNKEREEQLTALFQECGHELEFVGEYHTELFDSK